MKRLAFMLCLLGASLHLCAQGYIVPNGVYAGSGGLPGYEIDVLQNPTNGNFTGFTLIPAGINTFSFDGYLDEGVRVFMVSSNQPISLQPIQANSYPELTFGNSYVFASGAPFYVGLYTGPRWTFPQTDPLTYDDPLFGWAKLVNNQGVIQLLDSALAYKAQGIYAGTQNFVPEPSGLGLAALAGLIFGFHRWRNTIPRK